MATQNFLNNAIKKGISDRKDEILLKDLNFQKEKINNKAFQNVTFLPSFFKANDNSFQTFFWV